jgi:hypothetical protein
MFCAALQKIITENLYLQCGYALYFTILFDCLAGLHLNAASIARITRGKKIDTGTYSSKGRFIQGKKESSISFVGHTLEKHIMGTERRAQIRPAYSIFY